MKIGVAESPLVTQEVYLAIGEERVRRFLGEPSNPERQDLMDAFLRARGAVARVRVTWKRTEGAQVQYFSTRGTGVFVEDGEYVLTAGHVIAGFPGDVLQKVMVTTGSGAEIGATVLEAGDKGPDGRESCALLKVSKGGPGAPFPSLALGVPRPDTLVAVLGYPHDMGTNAQGSVVSGAMVSEEPFAPLACIGRVASEVGNPLLIRPLAGCIPQGGMSGGPVLDSEGRVVALFAATNVFTAGPALKVESVGGKEVSRTRQPGKQEFTLDAIPVGDVSFPSSAPQGR